MTTRSRIHLRGLALNFQGGHVPQWIQLTPAGPEVTGRDGRSWRLSDTEAVVRQFADQANPIVVDIEHASETMPSGDAAPAQGWVEDLEVRDGALWGRVNWNVAGQALMAAQAYRYVSPAFLYDPDSREILELRSVALTHSPNFQMQALNASTTATPTENADMDKAIREALGLAADATAADAVVAINQLREERATALNAARQPDPEKYVPKADHELALNRLQEFERAEAERAAADQQAAVDAAVEAGKIAPASREPWLAHCRTVGVEKFNELLATMPVIAGETGKPAAAKGASADATALNAEQAALARALGVSHEAYAATAQKGA